MKEVIIQPTEHDDDEPVGRVLTRREVIALLAGLGGTTLLAACGTLSDGASTPGTPTVAGASVGTKLAATFTPVNEEARTVVAATPVQASPTADTAAVPDCVVRPEQTEGPYFVDEKLNRSDIRSDASSGTVKEGAPLTLAFLVSQVGSGACTPLEGAQIDVWHCDAVGVYSDTSDPNWGSTVGQTFLRGYQVTGADGKADFITIYPGWYQGRTVHIHFKIRTTGADGQAYEFTSQLFFDDAFTDQVFAQPPYNSKGQRTLRNAGDGIYRNGGSQLTLAVAKSGDGYAATFPIGLDLSDASVGKADGGQGGGPAGPGGSPRP